jgi:hypothetical protein
MEYKEYGMEKWLIQTTILGRLDEAEGTSMEYTEAYIEWNFSVEIAMQGAIARICCKYHDFIPRTSAYWMFGEHSKEGNPVDCRGQEFHSICQSYFTEREYNIVNLEDMLKKQISVMDQFRQLMDLATKRIIETESALVMMGDQRNELKETSFFTVTSGLMFWRRQCYFSIRT